MKRFLFLFLLLLPVVVSANDVSVKYVDTVVAADTAAQAINADTSFTGTIPLHGVSRCQFYYSIAPYNGLFNLTADTFYVYLQHSFDQIAWRNVLLGKATDTTHAWSTVNYSAADSVIGNWGRFMIIHRDSTEAYAPDSLGNVRGVEYKLWISKIF